MLRLESNWSTEEGEQLTANRVFFSLDFAGSDRVWTGRVISTVVADFVRQIETLRDAQVL
jgi:hypothetical protein